MVIWDNQLLNAIIPKRQKRSLVFQIWQKRKRKKSYGHKQGDALSLSDDSGRGLVDVVMGYLAVQS